MKEDNAEKNGIHPEEDNLINQNASELDSKRVVNDTHNSNVDPLKPQFERNNLQSDREKRQGNSNKNK